VLCSGGLCNTGLDAYGIVGTVSSVFASLFVSGGGPSTGGFIDIGVSGTVFSICSSFLGSGFVGRGGFLGGTSLSLFEIDIGRRRGGTYGLRTDCVRGGGGGGTGMKPLCTCSEIACDGSS
jgi:hypothetical protein